MSVRLTTFILAIIVAGCAPESPRSIVELPPPEPWVARGLQGRPVTALAKSSWGLIAGTKGEGVFRRSAAGVWESGGLEGMIVEAIAETAEGRLVAAVSPLAGAPIASILFVSPDGGETWLEVDGGLARRHGGDARATDVGVDPSNRARVFATTTYAVLRSEDAGRSWVSVFGKPDVQAGYRTIFFELEVTDRRVLAGGSTHVWSPIVIVSDDDGESWLETLMAGADDGVGDMEPDPDLPDRIWGSSWDQIHRSDDGGSNWHAVGDLDHTLEIEFLDGAMYAASYLLEPRGRLALSVSRDGGRTWERIPVPGPLDSLGADTVIVDRGMLWIGTSDGVWTFDPAVPRTVFHPYDFQHADRAIHPRRPPLAPGPLAAYRM